MVHNYRLVLWSFHIKPRAERLLVLILFSCKRSAPIYWLKQSGWFWRTFHREQLTSIDCCRARGPLSSVICLQLAPHLFCSFFQNAMSLLKVKKQRGNLYFSERIWKWMIFRYGWKRLPEIIPDEQLIVPAPVDGLNGKDHDEEQPLPKKRKLEGSFFCSHLKILKMWLI